MSLGSATAGAAVPLDVGAPGSPADNTFTRTDSAVGAAQPYWPAWWTYTPPSDGYLILDTSATEGTGFLDTLLNIRRDSSANPPFLGDDDSGDGPYGRASRIAVDVSAGVSYWVKVGSFSTDGDGITVYHVAAEFTAIPALPNPRTFTIPGGALTSPGLVMGPGVVAAPSMPPLSVSLPAVGLPDATFIFDATTYLDALGVPSAYITFDGTLSYLSDGTCDTIAPEVGLNIFHVNHALPFTWEEDWVTDFTGLTDGTDDYGREVPRGQSLWYVETGKTYIIQLTTPPGNDVRFILRVSAFGAHTAPTTIPDQEWRVTNDPYDSGAGDPVAYGPETIPWARGNDNAFDEVNVDSEFPAWSLQSAFHGSHAMLQGFGAVEPGSDLDAIRCSWLAARRGKAPFQWWTSDATVDGGDPGSCVPLADHDSAQEVSNGQVGYTYDSEGAGSFSGGSAGFNTYGNQFRLNISGLLTRFDAFAGVDPNFDAPDGYTNTGPIFSGPTGDPPELLAVKIAMDQLDTGAHAANGTRMYVSAFPYEDDGAGSWGPAGDSSTTDEWRGTTDGPEQYDGSHPVRFESAALTDVPLDTVWGAALEDEATADDSGGPTYLGGLSVVGLATVTFVDDLPDPTPTATVGESITDLSTYQFPVLFLRLRPTVTYRFVDYSVVPAVVVHGALIRLMPRWDTLGSAPVDRNYPRPVAERNYPVIQ